MGNGTGAMSGHESTDDLRRDIERTQREMSRTIDEIQHRLSPNYMMQRTKESMKEAGVNASRSFIDKVRDNPIPAAMVGIGMWLLMRDNDSSRDSSYDVEFIPERSRWDTADTQYSSVAEYRDFDYEGGTHGRMAGARERVSGAADSARERVSEVADTARERVGGAMSSAREATSDMLDSAGDAARRLGSRARYGVRRARYESRDLLRESPLIVGVAAIAAGAIIGALIPETERENELMGEHRDRLAEQAKDLARDGASRAKEVATAATQAATEAAKSEAKSQTRSASTDPTPGVNISSGHA